MSNVKTLEPGKAGSRRSCLMYGCLALVVLMLAVAVGMFFAGRYAMNRLALFVTQYTETTQMSMETVERIRGLQFLGNSGTATMGVCMA